MNTVDKCEMAAALYRNVEDARRWASSIRETAKRAALEAGTLGPQDAELLRIMKCVQLAYGASRLADDAWGAAMVEMELVWQRLVKERDEEVKRVRSE